MAALALRMTDGYQRACGFAAVAAFGAGCAEFAFGRWAHSSYLTSDAIGWGYSCAVYALAAFSYRSAWRNKAALALAAIFLVQGCHSAVEVAQGFYVQSEAAAREIAIGSVGALSLALVLAATFFIYRRSDDAEHQATWLAARNDVLTSGIDIAVVCVSKLVLISDWPETASDAAGAALILWAGGRVAITALRAMRDEHAVEAYPLHASA